MWTSERELGTNPDSKNPRQGQGSRHLSAVLSDIHFRNSIVRLAHHMHSEAGKEFSKQAADECLQQLSNISFAEVPCVKTEMLKLNKQVSSQTKMLSFVHKKEGNPRQSVVYLDASESAVENSKADGFLLKLVCAVQFVVGLTFDGLLLYQMMKSPRQADDILDEAGIQYYEVQKDLSSSVTPKPGSFVPLCHHHQLDNGFHEFARGESVALEVFDPLIVGENSENDIPVYIYATILYEVGDGDAETVFSMRYHVHLGPDRGETDVSMTRLYKLTDTSANQTETDSSPDNAQDHVTTQEMMSTRAIEKGNQTSDIPAIFKDLSQTLTKAWHACQEKEEFHRVTKRLALQWHENKHIKESVKTCATKAIFQYADLLELGESLPEDVHSTPTDSVDGRIERSSVKAFHESYARRVNRQGHYKTSGVGGLANPQPGEGWRWFYTAQCDWTVAVASRGLCDKGRNWVCFLCHQAVEKALKGVLYLRDADSECLQSHSLPYLSRTIGDSALQQLAHQMESRMGPRPYTRMRYPDVLVYPKVPADEYSADDVNLACDLGQQVLERAQWLMKSA